MDSGFCYIKPLRNSLDDFPILSSKRCRENHYKNIETTILVDLNILAEMSRVIENKVAYHTSYLALLVKSLNELEYIFLSSGLALMEANEEYKIKMHKNFNLFLTKYLPRFYDAHNTVDDVAELKNSQNFTNLNSQEKFHYVIPYLSLLKINFINKQFKELPSFARFKKYITYMAFEANNISALETEIANSLFSIIQLLRTITHN
ncbi:hypothetical protein I862_06840 [endosymbiont of Acanthamoeba sp. UWC8]|uniref:hypothetical protein n=1 Tax=endosymbiont of Acanthamoeba sp. UWC8 TaxID=86106 RepID=UPI0004D19D6B|nr:hypothetical protein [endosymbiont of Acanthamoeba sp. UWC8]AIF81922.1 hypothetical protein I862_06840 [endosymbiont of Acanthamoeba sp. UWC8]